MRDGANKLYRDSGLGLLVNTITVAAAGAVMEFMTNLPGYVSLLVAGGAGILLNGFTAWKAKHLPAGDSR